MKRHYPTKALFAAAALVGLISGSSVGRAAILSKIDKNNTPVGVLADDKTKDTHACKGKNSCKGKGGCKTGDKGCAGKNSCKGKGGCASKNSCKGKGGCGAK